MRSATLRRIIILLSLYSSFALSDSNVTIDDFDASVILSPFRAWGWSNQGDGKNGGTFSFSNSENATATITFTQNATAVFWQGFKRSGPALYSVCLDCTSPSQAQIVDGHEDNSQLTNSVAILFASTNLRNYRHTITIKNLVDPRFGFPSQITLDAFILTLPNSSTPSTSTTSTTTQTSASMPSGLPSQTMVAYWSKTNSATATLSTGAVVGIAFASAIVLFGAVALGWWLLRRRRRAYGKVSRVAIFGQNNEKDRLASGERSPMSSTLYIPPRNAEQASMFGSTVTKASSGHTSYKAPDPSPSPLMHHNSPRAPSIRSALSSILSRTPSARSVSSRSEWGTIHVALSNPFASPHDVETESEWDFDSPLPSSTLESAFAPTPGDRDGERTPTLSRGWRRVEEVRDGHTSGMPTHPSGSRPQGQSSWSHGTPASLI